MTLEHESRASLLTRKLKKMALGARRLAHWQLNPEFASPVYRAERLSHIVYSTRVSLSSTRNHPLFEAGKRHNVALATPAFDGLRVSLTRPFSFWKTMGRVTSARGYRLGMELSGGCLVPAIGGGLCLLARVLFQAAVYSGCRILERHGHSVAAESTPLPQLPVPRGFDATVLWPYVDLRFAPNADEMHISAKVKDGFLVVAFSAASPMHQRFEVTSQAEATVLSGNKRSFSNHLMRLGFDAQGTLFSRELVARNNTNLVEHQRSCFTCEKLSCHARPPREGVAP
jgi:vancomycin resistance protein VanW